MSFCIAIYSDCFLVWLALFLPVKFSFASNPVRRKNKQKLPLTLSARFSFLLITLFYLSVFFHVLLHYFLYECANFPFNFNISFGPAVLYFVASFNHMPCQIWELNFTLCTSWPSIRFCPWLQLCNIWASWRFCSRWHYHHLEWCV